VVGASIVLVLLLPLADMIPLVSFQTDEKFEDIERQHRAFVERAESILLSGQDYEQAESYLEKARALLIKSPTGDFSPRSMKCDYYYAWLLCRKHNSRGYKLFDKILKNDGLSPEQKRVIGDQRDKCQSGSNQSRLVEMRKDTFSVHSEIQKGRQWSQPVYLRSRHTLPSVGWSNLQIAEKAISTWLGPSMHVARSEPFLIIGRSPSNYLQSLGNTVLQPYYKYLQRQIGLDNQSRLIYAFVAKDHAQMAMITTTFYEVNASQDWLFVDDAIAYSDAEGMSMMAICGPDAANCTSFAHELFHVLNAMSYEDAPWWLSEGMAELYESGNLIGGDFRPKVNWRKKYLSRAGLSVDEVRGLLTLSTNNPALNSPPGSAEDMAYARFFCQYLQTQAKLWDVYHALRNRNWEEAINDPSGVAALEKELGKPLEKIASDFREWIVRDVLPVQPSTKHP